MMKKQEIIRILKEAREHATFENFGTGNEERDKLIKEEIEIYTNSWIIAPIDEALALIIGGK